MGTESGFRLSLGQDVSVRLTEATSESGGIIFELINVEGSAVPYRPVGKSRLKRRSGRQTIRTSKKKRKKTSR